MDYNLGYLLLRRARNRSLQICCSQVLFPLHKVKNKQQRLLWGASLVQPHLSHRQLNQRSLLSLHRAKQLRRLVQLSKPNLALDLQVQQHHLLSQLLHQQGQ